MADESYRKVLHTIRTSAHRGRRRSSEMPAVLCCCLLAAAAACHALPSTRVAPAQDVGLVSRIEERVAREPGAFVGVQYIDLGGHDTFGINADSVMHAASTMKLPVMMRLYRESDNGTLSLDSKVLLVNSFASITDGSRYALDPGVDSDSAMYRLVGDSVTVRELVRHMITRSSNLATNTLISLANPDSVNAMMRALGAGRMRVLRGVEDQKAFDAGLNNTATAHDLGVLLQALETGRAASPAATAEMLAILSAQEFNQRIPAGLPPGTRVAHKTGDITAIAHDAAIVYPPTRPPYVLVVLTRGVARQPAADSLIADISREVYSHATSR